MRGRVWWRGYTPRFGRLFVGGRVSVNAGSAIIIGKNRLHQFATGLVGIRHTMASRTFQ
jgi:hypothetical protein